MHRLQPLMPSVAGEPLGLLEGLLAPVGQFIEAKRHDLIPPLRIKNGLPV